MYFFHSTFFCSRCEHKSLHELSMTMAMTTVFQRASEWMNKQRKSNKDAIIRLCRMSSKLWWYDPLTNEQITSFKETFSFQPEINHRTYMHSFYYYCYQIRHDTMINSNKRMSPLSLAFWLKNKRNNKMLRNWTETAEKWAKHWTDQEKDWKVLI